MRFWCFLHKVVSQYTWCPELRPPAPGEPTWIPHWWTALWIDGLCLKYVKIILTFMGFFGLIYQLWSKKNFSPQYIIVIDYYRFKNLIYITDFCICWDWCGWILHGKNQEPHTDDLRDTAPGAVHAEPLSESTKTTCRFIYRTHKTDTSI